MHMGCFAYDTQDWMIASGDVTKIENVTLQVVGKLSNILWL